MIGIPSSIGAHDGSAAALEREERAEAAMEVISIYRRALAEAEEAHDTLAALEALNTYRRDIACFHDDVIELAELWLGGTTEH